MRSRDPLRALLVGIAIPSFVFYVGWNLFFLGSGRIPPSILFHFTGIPSPTTGSLRALYALLEFSIADSLAWNPFLLPYLVLIAATIWTLASAEGAARDRRLPNSLSHAWIALLIVSWGYQVAFFQP